MVLKERSSSVESDTTYLVFVNLCTDQFTVLRITVMLRFRVCRSTASNLGSKQLPVCVRICISLDGSADWLKIDGRFKSLN